MEDDRGYQYGRKKIYKERLVLYCLNNKRKLKCPGIVKTDDSLEEFEVLTSHNNACSMQCLRRKRNPQKTKPKTIEKKKNEGFSKSKHLFLSRPSKKFEKEKTPVSSEDIDFGSELSSIENQQDDEISNFTSSKMSIKEEIEQTLSNISRRLKEKALLSIRKKINKN